MSDPQQPVLSYRDAAGREQRFALTGKRVDIGSSETLTPPTGLRIVGQDVESTHVQLFNIDASWSVRPVRQGVLLNGKPLTSVTRLVIGSTLRIGQVELTYEIASPAAPRPVTARSSPPPVTARPAPPPPIPPAPSKPAAGQGLQQAAGTRIPSNLSRSKRIRVLTRSSVTQSRLLAMLPPIFQRPEHGSDQLENFLLGFEDILDPLEALIANFDYYLDPRLTSDAMLPWLASWLGLVLDERLDLDQQRTLAHEAATLYRMRGTPTSLARYLTICTRCNVQIIEQGQPINTFRVLIEGPGENLLDQELIRQIIDAEKPAHTTYTLEFRP